MLFKRFGERILHKLRQNFGTDDILFSLLTLGQIFEIAKTVGWNRSIESKLPAKYGLEKHSLVKR